MNEPKQFSEGLIQLRMQFLINRCKDQKAFDKGYYNEQYTEITLLRAAKFTINEQGLLSTELTNNPYFQKNYAEGKKLHQLLQPELEHLGNILKWEFDKTCDFNTNLVFSETFTNTLIPELAPKSSFTPLTESIKLSPPSWRNSSAQTVISNNDSAFFNPQTLVSSHGEEIENTTQNTYRG